MAYCPKCGAKVSEDMAFCPKCGAALKAEQPQAPVAPAPPVYRRDEKAEKGEKHEKEEKGEKTERHEKGEFGFLGPLIGGLILICLGFMSYLQVTGYVGREIAWAVFLIFIGIVIIVAALYGLTLARRRHPQA